MPNIKHFWNKEFMNNWTTNSNTKVNVAGKVKPDIKKWNREGFLQHSFPEGVTQ